MNKYKSDIIEYLPTDDYFKQHFKPKTTIIYLLNSWKSNHRIDIRGCVIKCYICAELKIEKTSIKCCIFKKQAIDHLIITIIIFKCFTRSGMSLKLQIF